MRPSNLSGPASSAVSSAAISAFLRGIERRAIVLAGLQAGDRHTAETALAASMRAFLMQASNIPIADWPARFWTLLASAPRLRQPLAMATVWPAGLGALGGMPALPRLALLLRLVAVLDEEQAAAAMGLSVSAYRDALAQACPRDAAGQPDAVAWRMLAEAAQQQVRDIPSDQLAHLAGLRDAAIAGAIVVPATAPTAPAVPAPASVPRRRRWRWLVVALLLCTAALAAAWWWLPSLRQGGVVSEGDALRVIEHGAVEVEALPAEGSPAGADAGVSSADADAVMLADTAGMALARDADLYAWYATGAPVPGADASPAAVDDGATEIPETGESSDATL
jgi:hypothetical protein